MKNNIWVFVWSSLVWMSCAGESSSARMDKQAIMHSMDIPVEVVKSSAETFCTCAQEYTRLRVRTDTSAGDPNLIFSACMEPVETRGDALDEAQKKSFSVQVVQEMQAICPQTLKMFNKFSPTL